MSAYYVQFWRGQDRIIDYEEDEHTSLNEARQHIEDLIREMMEDCWVDDWTGCRFEVATSGSTTVLSVPVLEEMSVLVRRKHH